MSPHETYRSRKFQNAFHPRDGERDFDIFLRKRQALEKLRAGRANLGKPQHRPPGRHGFPQQIQRQRDWLVGADAIITQKRGRQQSGNFTGSHIAARYRRKWATLPRWNPLARRSQIGPLLLKNRRPDAGRLFLGERRGGNGLAVFIFAEQSFEEGSHGVRDRYAGDRKRRTNQKSCPPG